MLPLYAFRPSTQSQHCTHAVTFPSETITCAPYATQNAWSVNCSHIFAIDMEDWLFCAYLETTAATPDPRLTKRAWLRYGFAGSPGG